MERLMFLPKLVRRLLPALVISALALSLVGPMVALKEARAAVGMIPLSLVYYSSHDAATDQRIMNARPAILISNTPAGYWHGNCDSAKFQAQGIRVYSYIYANYDQFPLAQNQALIDAIAREGTYGIFVDMVNPSATAYNQALYSYAKSRGLSVIINPGFPNVNPNIYSVADYVMTDEHYSGRDPSPAEAAHLNQTIVIGFNSAWSAQTAATYSNTAWAKGFAYTWHEQIEYMSLPSWFEQYISLLTPGNTPIPAPTPAPIPTPKPTPVSGNTIGTVANQPVSSGGANEYNFYLRVTSTTVAGLASGQQVWCATTTADFPNLLTVGATLSGNLDHSPGWWVFKKTSTPAPSPTPTPTPTPSPSPTPSPTPAPISGNTIGKVASAPASSGGANEYNLYLNVTSTTVPGFTAGQQVWCAATIADFPNLLTVGATLSGNLDHSPGWWVFKKATYPAPSPTPTPTPTPSPSPPPAPVRVQITKSVAAGLDDGFSGAWAFAPSSTWYQVGSPGAGTKFGAWFRFNGFSIPTGAHITAARLDTVEGKWAAGTALKIRAEKSINPGAPSSSADFLARSRTAAGVDWTSGYADWAWHSSPDFSAVIQELVNSFSYSGSQSIQIFVDDNGSRAGSEATGDTFESGLSPRLLIEYTR